LRLSAAVQVVDEDGRRSVGIRYGCGGTHFRYYILIDEELSV
jgi:hypothetical protein